MKTRTLALSLAMALSSIGVPFQSAQAINFGSVRGIYQVAADYVGENFGIELDQYLEDAYTQIQDLAGVDIEGLDLADGSVSPQRFSDAIREQLRSRDSQPGQLTPEVEAGLLSSEISAQIGGAIPESVLSDQAREKSQAVNEQISNVVESQGELAETAQSAQVTKEVMQTIAQQNAQESTILAALSSKQDLTNQQLAGVGVSAAVTAEQAAAEERRRQEGANQAIISRFGKAAFVQGLFDE